MSRIEFTVFGKAIPKQSTKIFVNQHTGKPRCYTPQTKIDWHNDVRMEAIRVKPETPFTGPLMAILTFYLPMPKSKPKWKKYADKKPDIDNLVKNVLDPLHNIVFDNDSQVVCLKTYKLYAKGLVPPQVIVCIEEIDEKGEVKDEEKEKE